MGSVDDDQYDDHGHHGRNGNVSPKCMSLTD